MHSPTDASPVPSQEPAHGSGPMQFATPSSWRTFTAYSSPVSPAHHMPGTSTTPGHTGTRAIAPIRVAFQTADGVGSRDSTLSRLIGWPMHSPADASPTPSREPAHGSGPMRFATPSSWRTFTTYSLPVSPAHRRTFIGSLLATAASKSIAQVEPLKEGIMEIRHRSVST